MIFLFSNFGDTRLSARLTAASTTALIAPSDAERFPRPELELAESRFAAILYDGEQMPEVVWCSENPLDGTLTIERGQENSVAKSWPAGTAFVHTLTSASIQYFVTSGQQDWLDALIASLGQTQAALDQEIAARQALAASMATQFTNAYTAIGGNTSAIQLVSTNFADLQQSWANYQITVNASLDDADSSIQSLTSAFTDFETAQGETNTLIATRVGNAEAYIEEVDLAQSTFETATSETLLTLSADLNDAEAAIAAESSARVTQYDALASQANTLSVNFGTLSGSVTTNAMAIATLEGAVETTYSIELDAAGVFTNFKLIAGVGPAGATVSEARFGVDKLRLSTADGLRTPFLFDVGEGVAYLNEVKVERANLDDAIIGTAQIENLAVESAKIGTLAVTSAKIDDLAVTEAKIGNLAVDTIKIKDFAVTDPITAYTSGSITLTGNGGRTLIQQVTITVTGSERVDILGTAAITYVPVAAGFIFTPTGDGGGTITTGIGERVKYISFELERNGTVVYNERVVSLLRGIEHSAVPPVAWSESPAPGTYTYALWVDHGTDDSDINAADARDRFLSATRVKK